MKDFPIQVEHRSGSLLVTGPMEEWVKAHDKKGKVPFQMNTEYYPPTIRGMTMGYPNGWGAYSNPKSPVVFYGVRTLSRAEQTGFQMEGIVSIGGTRYRAHTSSVLVEFECNFLISVAVLFVHNAPHLEA